MRGRISIFAAILAVAFLQLAAAGQQPTVLLIARGETADIGTAGVEFMIQKEVFTMVSILKQAGYAVEIASVSGANLKAGSTEMKVDKKLAEVKAEDYVGVIVPCMGEIPEAVPQQAVDVIRAAFSKKMPLAAQQSGVQLLGAAGALKGKNYAIGEDFQDYVQGGNYKGTGVVTDGLLVTSGTCPWMSKMTGMPDGTKELTTIFITLLKKQ